MSHVTEGELHAYIDGALASIDAPTAERVAKHLDECGDCEARAEEARVLRDRTSVLLDTALGEPIAAPPFEELVEKAGSESDVDIGVRDARSSRRPWRVQRFAWAASLVVALGAGWMANALLRDSGGVSLQTAAEPAAEGPIDADATFDANRQQLANATAPAGPTEERPSRPTSQNERLTSPLAVEARDARENVARDALRDDANVDPVAVTGGDAKLEVSGFEAAGRGRRAEDRLAAAPEVQNRASGFADTERVTQEQVALEGESLASLDEVAKASAAADEPEAFGLESDELDRLAWRRVEVVEAAEWVGGILTLPDVDVEEYALSAHEGQRLARVRQRLPGGETLELVQLKTEPAPDELLEASRRELDLAALGRALAETGSRAGAFTLGWIELNGLRVRASAPVAPDSLRTLISRIRRP